MKSKIVVLLLTLSFSLLALSSSPRNELPLEDFVDIERYMGTWYAQYDIPARFSKRCVGQSAYYELQKDGSVFLRNTCFRENRKPRSITGKAVVVNRLTNSKLSIQFNNFFTRLFGVRADYNIIKLADDYSMVMVGTVDRSQLWIMSRDQYAHEAELQEFVNYAQDLGFDISKLRRGEFR